MTLKLAGHWVDSLVRPQCKGFEPYLPGRSLESVRRERGLKRLYKLASNENALGPSRFALQAVKKIGSSILRYPDGASMSLRQALARHVGLSEKQVIIGAGSDELIELLGKTFLNPGDSIVVSEHAFIRYRMAADLMGAATIAVPMQDLTHDLNAMGQAIREDTKIVFIANPNNPTGTFNTHDQLEVLLRRTQQLANEGRPVLVVVDEAYYEFAAALDNRYPDTLELQKRYPQLVILRTFSKIHALAGLRVGYGFADPEIISALDRVRPPFNVSTVGQVAAEAALGDKSQIAKGIRLVRQGRKLVLDALARMGLGVIPSVGNFVLIDVSPRRGKEVFEKLLDRGVIVRAMDEYDLPNHVRVTFGLPVENRLFVKALKEVVGR
jgi:histidinol-phosphate aminotransferase